MQAAPVPRDMEERIKLERTGGKLAVDVHVRGKVRFRHGVVRTRWYTLRASCPGVAVGFASPTKFGGVYCYVHV